MVVEKLVLLNSYEEMKKSRRVCKGRLKYKKHRKTEKNEKGRKDRIDRSKRRGRKEEKVMFK